MINTTLSLGGIAILDKIEKSFGFFSEVFKGVEGRANDFISLVKLHMYNKMTHSVSVNQILETYPEEIREYLQIEEMPGERTLYRTLERIGKNFEAIHHNYQKFTGKHKLVDEKQLVDFSSFYLEGEKAELGEQGYSRDRRPDKLQINFGIATGINGIPSALTIQKGNVDDKKHMREMLKLLKSILSENSLLIFDAGANTKSNKDKIRELGYNYLTLKPKQLGSYKSHIAYFVDQHNKGLASHFVMNEREYTCVKKQVEGKIFYICFCPQLLEVQLKKKEKKFKRQIEKGNKTLRQRKNPRLPSNKGWVELVPHLQGTLAEIENPYITGIEGFFILESSVDADPEKILKLYKERDKAEKFIRNLKEGLELRPIRHWNNFSVIGMIFICFLTNFLINLTLFLSKNPLVKNVKLLKKFLINLTLTIIYPKNAFRLIVVSNISPQILSVFGDFVQKYGEKNLDLRW